MERKNQYYVVRDKALPEVLQKVVEVHDDPGGGGEGRDQPEFLL